MMVGPRYVYGPVPSRRLGRSLGIDLVPFKACPYDCVYCQLGRTTRKTVERKEYAPIDAILEELERKLGSGPPPDFVSLAGSGEPTLHARIGELIGAIRKRTEAPVAVLTNGALLLRADVRHALREADVVIPSLDAGDGEMFRRINRPHLDIRFEAMVEGLGEFRRTFGGRLWLEAMLLAGLMGIASEVDKIAALARQIRPDRVQLNTPTRPPCEAFAHPVPLDRLRSLAARFDGPCEVIGGGSTPPPAEGEASDEDILALLARRPCTVRDVAMGLGLSGGDLIKRLEGLLDRGKAVARRMEGELYYESARKP